MSIVGVIALYFWKRWGFYVLCWQSVVLFVGYLGAHDSPLMAFVGLLPPVVMYGALQLGGEDRAY
ncbi:MAG: hypothetical protein ABSE48_06825, partial [Verrucomicrobiota bacterium]